MLLEKNVVGKKTDWANYITLADEHETPALRILPKGPKPVNVVKNYQSDTYNDPVPNAWPDGKDWDAFQSAGVNRKPLSARVQWFVRTAAVSKLAEDVTDTAGITDELAHEIPKKMTEMAREMECSACSDQVAFADDSETGHKFRGMGAWITNPFVADADVAVDPAIQPPVGSILNNVASTALTEDNIITAMQAMWDNTGSVGRKLALVGKSLKKRFRDFQFFLPTQPITGVTAPSTPRVTNRTESDKTLGNVIDYYDSDWGMLELHMTKWNAHPNFNAPGVSAANAAGRNAWRGYFLNSERWGWLWNQKPTVYKPEFRGGSYKAAIDAILMFVCWNPIGEGKVAPNDF